MGPRNYLVIRGLNVAFIKNRTKLLDIPQITKLFLHCLNLNPWPAISCERHKKKLWSKSDKYRKLCYIYMAVS